MQTDKFTALVRNALTAGQNAALNANHQRLTAEHVLLVMLGDENVTIQINTLAARLAERSITLKLDDAATAWLSDKGYDPHFGARPLQRVIQNTVQNPLAEALLSGTFGDGDTVLVSVDAGGKLTFSNNGVMIASSTDVTRASAQDALLGGSSVAGNA